MKSEPLFLDYCATTPTDPRVVDAMLPFFTDFFGNGSQQHSTFGSREVSAVKTARQHVRSLIGVSEGRVVFTSGATESNNLAIKGICESHKHKGNHIVTQVTEHSSVLNCFKFLQSKGFEVTYLPVDQSGRTSSEAVRNAITDKTILVSIMWANNEIGTIQPITEIGSICRNKGVLFHSDGAQALTKVKIDVAANYVDALTVSGHKIYGPKGVGALFIGKFAFENAMMPIMHGGGQENGLRSTTLNVPGIVGLGEACRIANEQAGLWDSAKHSRDAFESLLAQKIDGIEFNGSRDRLPNISNVSLPGIDSEVFVAASPKLIVATGSACNFGGFEPSHVLQALNKTPDVSKSSIRVSFGRTNSVEDARFAAMAIADTCKSIA